MSIKSPAYIDNNDDVVDGAGNPVSGGAAAVYGFIETTQSSSTTSAAQLIGAGVTETTVVTTGVTWDATNSEFDIDSDGEGDYILSGSAYLIGSTSATGTVRILKNGSLVGQVKTMGINSATDPATWPFQQFLSGIVNGDSISVEVDGGNTVSIGLGSTYFLQRLNT